MGFQRMDTAWIVYQGGPRWDGEKWVDGESFILSGRNKLNLGVELAPGITGLDRSPVEYRHDTSASVPGARFVSEIKGRRDIKCAVNILGDDPADMRYNIRRWERNNVTNVVSRLWVFTSDGEPRFLPVRISDMVGQSTQEKEPALGKGKVELDWGWVSDESDFLGYMKKARFQRDGSDWTTLYYNPSTAERVYPTLYLPGGCQWTVPLGYEQGTYTTPPLEAGSLTRVDMNPANPTIIKKTPSGEYVNLWPHMKGRRPKMYLERETKNTMALTHSGGEPDEAPWIEFRPRFVSWI